MISNFLIKQSAQTQLLLKDLFLRTPSMRPSLLGWGPPPRTPACLPLVFLVRYTEVALPGLYRPEGMRGRHPESLPVWFAGRCTCPESGLPMKLPLKP